MTSSSGEFRHTIDEFLDRRGVTVRVGDTIAWAVSNGSVAELKIGKVEHIYMKNGNYAWQRGLRVVARADNSKYISTIEKSSRIVRLEVFDAG